MIEKKDEDIQATNRESVAPDTSRVTPSLIPPLLCAIAYALCVLLMAAPLSRAYLVTGSHRWVRGCPLTGDWAPSRATRRQIPPCCNFWD